MRAEWFKGAAAQAFANAIFTLTGKRLRTLPFDLAAA
jgi:CO/xanthine dehydrogenase Mo-binding subunit